MSDYPDFTITALLKGIYAGNPKALAVDVDGNMIAMLKALYGIVPTTLQCDVDGNMQINLTAQALDEIINRSKFGAPDYVTAQKVVAELATETLIDISGKGHIYASVCNVSGAITAQDKIIITMDSETISNVPLTTLYAYRMMKGMNMPVGLSRYSLVDSIVSAALTPGYTFETQYKIQYYHGNVPMNGSVTVTTHTYYSLI